MNTTGPPLELHTLEKLREEEREEARAIQSAMLPAELLRAGAVMIAHEFQPVAAVGGDFLDYFELIDGSVGLYLGDVSGKGLPAALYARWRWERCAAYTTRTPRLSMSLRL
jgi:serine phosphatase RsbU (regulator of sigma subunit)